MSFFDKLKKGVGVEEVEEETIEQKPAKKRGKKQEELKEEIIAEEREQTSTAVPKKAEASKEWFESEGQLAVDVFQTNGHICIQSAIAGLGPQDIDITIENDMVIIKGNREKPLDITPGLPKDYFYQECYWGPFSRQIILPAEVDNSRAEASMKNGILTIKVPKIQKEKKRKLSIKEQ